jgi:hypothetical protein
MTPSSDRPWPWPTSRRLVPGDDTDLPWVFPVIVAVSALTVAPSAGSVTVTFGFEMSRT